MVLAVELVDQQELMGLVEHMEVELVDHKPELAIQEVQLELYGPEILADFHQLV